MSRHHGKSGRPIFENLTRNNHVSASLPRWARETDPWLEIGETVVTRDHGECEVLGSDRGGDKITLKDSAGCQVRLTRAQFQSTYRSTIRDYAANATS